MGINGLEEPVLWIGTAGFTDEEKACLDGAMKGASKGPRWMDAPAGEVDAWLVNGARVVDAQADQIEVQTSFDHTKQNIRLRLKEVSPAVAFASPVPEGLRHHRQFQLASPVSVIAAFRRLEIQLRPLRAEFAIGRQMMAHGAQLRHGVFHLKNPRNGELLAVLNFRSGRAGVAPDVHPAEVDIARWEKRPDGAGGLPPGFTSMTTAQLSWTYVRHSLRKHLPTHYSKRLIYYRSKPRVPLPWLSDFQLAVLRELSLGPTKLDAINVHFDMTPEQVERELACLCFASAITTTTSKAAYAHRGRNDSSWISTSHSLRQPARVENDASGMNGSTVPAWLSNRND